MKTHDKQRTKECSNSRLELWESEVNGGNPIPPNNRHKKNVSTTAVRPTIEALGMPEQDDETE